MRPLLTARLLPALVLLVSARAAHPLSAQTSDSVTQAAAAITAAEVTRYLTGLASDSLRPGATPSPALDRTAGYVTHALQRLGLKPGIPDPQTGQPTWLQRYSVPGQPRPAPAATSPSFVVWLAAS